MHPFNVVSVMTAYNKGWILEKISNIILGCCSEDAELVTTDYFLVNGNKLYGGFPYSQSYLFMHYKHFLELSPHLELSQHSFVWFTHYEEKHGITMSDFARRAKALNATILTPCAHNKKTLIENGLNTSSIHVIYGGYDLCLQDMQPDPQGHLNVCVVGGYYNRKRPELILNVAKNSPRYNFYIIGPSAGSVDNDSICWSKSALSGHIRDAHNITLVECEYSDYKHYMQRCGIYMMLSEVEGGPLGLMEAMAMGLYPVATPTGFVEDLLEGLSKDLIVSHSSSPQDISKAIDLASRMFIRQGPSSPKNIVRDMDWISFGKIASGLIESQLYKTSASQRIYIYKRFRQVAMYGDGFLKENVKDKLEHYRAQCLAMASKTHSSSIVQKWIDLFDSCARMIQT